MAADEDLLCNVLGQQMNTFDVAYLRQQKETYWCRLMDHNWRYFALKFRFSKIIARVFELLAPADGKVEWDSCGLKPKLKGVGADFLVL